MGVLNLTPDSFSDGGRYDTLEAALARFGRMVADGADWVDIGGESTRPGAGPVSEAEELRRVLPVIEAAAALHPQVPISIDTTKYAVAEAALRAGARMVNDVSGLRYEPRLADLCARHGAALVVMHSIGTPQTMQADPHYTDVVADVRAFLEAAARRAEAAGVPHILIDPGIGFGKTLAHNLELLRRLPEIAALPWPVLVGASRKRLVGDLTGRTDPTDRLAGTLALHYDALVRGARMLRVHDVKEAADSVSVYVSLHP